MVVVVVAVVVVLVDRAVVVVVVEGWRGPVWVGRRPPGESAAILAWGRALWNGGTVRSRRLLTAGRARVTLLRSFEVIGW